MALTPIENDSGGDVRDAVAEALEGSDLVLVAEKVTNRAIDKLKNEVSDMTEKEARKLQTDLDADAIVHGSLQKEGSSKVLKFSLYVNGKKSKGFSVQFSNPRSKKFKAALHDKMLEKINKVTGAEDGEPVAKKDKKKEKEPVDDEDPIASKGDKKKDKKADKKDKKKAKEPVEDEPEDTKVAAKDKKKDKKKAKPEVEPADDKPSDEEDLPRKASKSTAKLEAGGGGGVDDEEGGVSVRASAKGSTTRRAANRVAVRLDVGASFSARRLEFTSTADLGDVDGVDKRPKAFKPGPVPGARFEVEVYPLAFMTKGAAAGLGLAVDYDKVLSSKVVSGTEPEAGVQMTVNQLHYSLGLRYRLGLGSSPTSPNIELGIAYGRRKFSVNNVLMDRNNLDLPDTDYKYIAPTLGFRIPFTRSIAFVADGEAMLVRNAGPIQQSDSYGRAKVFGAGGQAGLDVVIGNRFAVKLVGEFSQVGFKFTGGGDLSNNRDNNPDTIDIGGAADRSFGGSATLGVLY
ncbi:MAG: hypothetical protein ABI867_27470 [Kofleriaceae bacterium]